MTITKTKTTKKLLLLSGLLVGLFTGCAQDAAAPARAATTPPAVTTTATAAQATDESPAAGSEDEELAANGYICKFPASFCCEPIGKNAQGQTVCINAVFCRSSPATCP